MDTAVSFYPITFMTTEALKLWFKKNTEELMARGYKEMAEGDQEFAELALEAQREVIHE